MAPIHVSSLPIVCWGLMFSLVTTIQALNATRIELFHSVAHDASPNPLATSISAILASTSDLVVITTPLTSMDAANDNKTDTRELLKTYSLIGANRILYKPANWTVESEALVNSTVWTRLKSTNTYACIVVDTAKNNESEAVISRFIDRLDSFCGAQDNVVLGFTSAVSDELSSYLQGRKSQQEKFIPRTMGETSALARQGLGDASTDKSDALTTAQNRLYVHSADIACLETASVDSTSETVGVKMTFCMGSECAPCQQQGMLENNPESSESQHKSSKLGLVVLLSCGTFLLGCGLVFYILFHKQFFLPDGNGKMEKEVATNLAYVLRV